MIVPDRLTDIFNRQRELAHAFHQIEKKNKVWEWDTSLEVPVSGVFGQERMRSLAWRVVEELAEAIDSEAQGHSDDCQEELIDVGHYLVELMLSSNLDAKEIKAALPEGLEGDSLGQVFDTMAAVPAQPNVRSAVPGFIKALGMALHALKFKPHKALPPLTNETVYRMRLLSVFFMYIELLKAARMSDEDFYVMYLTKNRVNHQRIIEGQ